MKILHLMLACFYIDNYSYQENYLPKYHKKQGHEVEIVASLFTFDENGKGKWIEKGTKYTNEYEIPVTRLDFKNNSISRTLRQYVGLYEELERFRPDIIFIHGVQFCDIKVVAKYLRKHPGIRVFADNHADFSNSAKTFVSKYIQHRILWRHCAQLINPYVSKFYGVLPARVDFLINEYKLPKEKVELLIMGADDDRVLESENPVHKQQIRMKYGIGEDDFLVMYGGKTDNYKKQVFMLMDAVNEIDNPKLKLIVFGSVIPELKEEVQKRCTEKVKYIGWVLAKDSYKYFASSDLVVFPGRHSVFWEQAAGQGIPLLVKEWPGTKHTNINGNTLFLKSDSKDEIKTALIDILKDNNYYEILNYAKKAKKEFLYSEIAKRSITLKND